MNLNQFKDWAVSQGTVGKFTDGGFVGECVSLINQCLGRVYGIRAGAWGHAKDWATNGTVAQYFDKVNSPQAGDIIVYPAVPGNPYGHIAISLGNGQMLEQNGRIARKVTVSPLRGGYIAILRRKGSTPPPQGGSEVSTVDLFTARRIAYSVWGINGIYTKENAINGDIDGDLNKNWVGNETNSWLQTRFDAPEAHAYQSWVAKQASGSSDEYVETKVYVKKEK